VHANRAIRAHDLDAMYVIGPGHGGHAHRVAQLPAHLPRLAGPQRTTLETLAAVALLRQHAPELEVRVVNVVDLMRLQPAKEHPHGLSDTEFDTLFTTNKPIVFAYHGYPWLIHRLTYRRTNHNDLDRFHLVLDVVERVPECAAHAAYLKQAMRDRLVEHREYIREHGEDMPEIRDWAWSAQ